MQLETEEGERLGRELKASRETEAALRAAMEAPCGTGGLTLTLFLSLDRDLA